MTRLLDKESDTDEKSIQFGTGGWRAIIGDEFIKSNIVRVAQGLADMMVADGITDRRVAVGYDRRFLSKESARWVAEVLAQNGIHVYLFGAEAPTPVIMHVTKTLGLPHGLAVTASHNPASYNGIKLFIRGGRDADEATTGRLEERISAVDSSDVSSLPLDEAIALGRVEIINPLNDYIDTILSMLDVERIRASNLRILVDPMFGVSKAALQIILMSARCEVEVIHDRHDAMFGGRMPSPSAGTLVRLSDMVVERGYDLGIGTDGDADRLGIIDEQGRYIHPNKIMAMLYSYLLRFKGWSGDVVRNVATTHLLDAIAAANGQRCHEVPVGFKHVSSKMIETGAIIGGESSGGLTVKGHLEGKDGIFAAGLLVEMISVTGRRLAELMADLDEEFGTYEMVEANLEFDPGDRNRLLDLLSRGRRVPTFDVPVERVEYPDGIKIYLDNGGWLIARFSGTEPLLRIFAERSTEVEAAEMITTMRRFLSL